MKKVLAILLYSATLFSQIVPDHFKLPKMVSHDNPKYNYQYDQPNLIQRNIKTVPTTSGIISNFISDIIVTGNGDTIWFGTGKGLSRTLDKGISFQNYYDTEPFKTDDVSGIAIYKNWVVVSTAYSQEINGENIPTGSGIKVSSDGGNTWNAYPQPKDAPNDSIISYGISSIYALPIVVDEQNLSYDILVTRKNLTSDSIVIWITSWAGELRKSTDFGATFKRVLLPPDDLDTISPTGGPYTFQYNPRNPPQGNDNHKCFCVAAENDSTIYVGTAQGINKSSDWGVSWRKYSFANTGSGNGVSGNFVVGLSVQRYGNNTIVWGACNPADTRYGTGQKTGVSFTTNSGASWNNYATEDWVFTHGTGFKDSLVYACTDNGIWRSYFTPVNFLWSKPSVIYDETIKDQIHTTLFYSADSQGDSVWVGSGDGLARTTDTTTSPWTSKWKIFRAYRDITSSNETYAAPNPFSPDDEVCRIFFRTGKSGAKITIKIFDFGMNYVRTILRNADRQTSDILWTAWDGKRDDGMQVANGVYFYRIEIDNETSAWGKILVLQ